MTEKTQAEILRDRIDVGSRAAQAYDLYMAAFIANRRKYIFQQFSSAPFDAEKLAELKRCDMALSDLEGTIQAEISVGKAAEEELKRLNN